VVPLDVLFVLAEPQSSRIDIEMLVLMEIEHGFSRAGVWALLGRLEVERVACVNKCLVLS
jgi:hypothetical protein